MAKHHLRHDKTCENCGHLVEERYCSKCGQENVETRQSFGHLVRHFMEDLTHYESNFWKTIKYLLFRPAYLTKTYLAGKRMSYVAPVKLYIFISFVAFFLPGITPDFNNMHKQEKEKGESLIKTGKSTKEREDEVLHAQDSLGDFSIESEPVSKEPELSLEQYDSIQASLPSTKKDGFLETFIRRKIIYNPLLKSEEGSEKIKEAFIHNFPKALFIYLPIFAFFIWLFHSKKKWYYFDHAIFTLHFFSFLLLTLTVIDIIAALIPWHFIMNTATLSTLVYVFNLGAILSYFYIAHRRLYNKGGMVSFIQASVILTINALAFFLLFIGFIIFILATAH